MVISSGGIEPGPSPITPKLVDADVKPERIACHGDVLLAWENEAFLARWGQASKGTLKFHMGAH